MTEISEPLKRIAEIEKQLADLTQEKRELEKTEENIELKRKIDERIRSDEDLSLDENFARTQELIQQFANFLYVEARTTGNTLKGLCEIVASIFHFD
jgi:adenylosuccinate synthase